ncbi:hypothetical protein Bca52824_018745 [Brassica carinata]|uniref:Uncharacterized protein n=1 Tax=Brassica carinata TaxID=52824 RepID=A0A8X8AYY1_BRACI|nr:hypothetical protein Bca52824_018745 [Brassica carinata]
MTTAARPTWAPAKGGNEQGGARIFGASQKYSSRDVAAHTTLKPRREGQHTQEEVQKKNLRDELEDRERIHFSSKDKSYSEDRDRRRGNQLLLEGSKRDPEDRIVPRSVDADDSDVDIKSDDESDDESDDDDEDDTEALMAELDQIKRERVEERLRKEKQQQMEELNAKEEELLKGNPLLNNTPTSFSVKRRWDDDVVFKNQARGEMKAPKRFINDTIRNDFHRKFLHRYMNRFEPYGSGFGGEGYGGRHMVVVLAEEGKATVDMVGPLNLAAQVSIMEEQVVHMGGVIVGSSSRYHPYAR